MFGSESLSYSSATNVETRGGGSGFGETCGGLESTRGSGRWLAIESLKGKSNVNHLCGKIEEQQKNHQAIFFNHELRWRCVILLEPTLPSHISYDSFSCALSACLLFSERFLFLFKLSSRRDEGSLVFGNMSLKQRPWSR